MMPYRSLLAIVAIAALPTACSAAPANPLLGHWQAELGGDVSAQTGNSYCKAVPEFIFTATTETQVAEGGARGTNSVIYLVSGADVYVSSTPGFVGAPKFTMLGANEMTLAWVGHCKYRRVGR